MCQISTANPILSCEINWVERLNKGLLAEHTVEDNTNVKSVNTICFISSTGNWIKIRIASLTRICPLSKWFSFQLFNQIRV